MATAGTSYNVAPNPDDSLAGLFPIGSMLLWSTSTAPSGFLLCNGAAVSRTAFAPLFAVIGTIWGAGDNSTTFNVPNTAGRVVRGVNGTYTQALTGGADSVGLVAANIPVHSHQLNDPGHTHGLSGVAANNQNNDGVAGVNRLSSIINSVANTDSALTSINVVDSMLTGNGTIKAYDYPSVPPTQVNIVNTFVAINHIIKAF